VKLIMTSLAVLALASGSARAADMPVKAPYLKAPPPAYSWTGCYLGGYVGGSVASGSATDLFSPSGAAYNGGGPNGEGYQDSVIGGGTLGCNYQVSAWVFGVEGEYGYIHNTSSFGWPGVGTPPSDGTSLDTKYNSTIGNWYAVAAGRVGYAYDHTMFYVKAGAAWTNVSSSVVDSCTTAVICGPGVVNAAGGISNALGYAAGGGLEWAFAGNWSLKAEALYLGFNKSYAVCGPGGGTTLCGSEKLTGIMTAKIGLNYRFDWGGPLVAKY
jgi:outer membrane immunogenic protein